MVCEAVAAPIARGVAEMSVDTREAHRRRGLGMAACGHIIREGEARGLQAYWGTSQENTPSIAMARRLGYHTERLLRVFSWPQMDLPAA